MQLLAALALGLHLAWILWVIFGAIWTKGRPWLTAFHLVSLVWGILVEVGPWPCPLTLAEQWLDAKAGLHTWTGSFLVHTLDAVVYPNLPVVLIVSLGVAVCSANLLLYLARLVRAVRARRKA
jgi:Protein of Unknown function (DUF2784)